MLKVCDSILESTVFNPPASLEDHINIKLSNVDNSQNQYLLGIVITNMSRDRIWFPIGMNGAYSYFDPKNEKWVPVKDTMKVISLRPQIILEPKGDIINDNFSYTIAPDLPNELFLTNNEIQIRIEISGYKMNGEEKTSLPIKASADFVINPSQ
jgi:hypothetical protein